MRRAIATLKSASNYSQSKFIDPEEHPRLDKELHNAYEMRTWRHRVHKNDDGFVIIPPTAFKNCLSEAAKYLSLSVPGKGKATYTKYFESGILVVEPLVLPIRWEDAKCEKLFLPSDGKRGGGKRVIKYMPVIHDWAGDVEFLVVDETITEPVFRHVLEEAGKFIGIGTFRPRNNGFYGRFTVEKLKWI